MLTFLLTLVCISSNSFEFVCLVDRIIIYQLPVVLLLPLEYFAACQCPSYARNRMYNVCVCTDLFRSLSVYYRKRVEKGLYVCMYYIVHVSHARVGFYEVGQCSFGLLNLKTTKYILKEEVLFAVFAIITINVIPLL